MKNDTKSSQCDVIDCLIIGGGAAGATAALLLANAGINSTTPSIKVTLVDAAQPAHHEDIATSTHHSRVFALSPASIRMFEHAGIWQYIARRADYHAMKVWFKNGAGELNFGEAGGHNIGNDIMLGSMVEPHIINHAIAQAINAAQSKSWVQKAGDNKNSLTTIYGARVKVIDNIRGGYKAKQTGANFAVMLEDGRELFARFIIGADGRRSFVREAVGISADTLDYKQTAICCAIKTEQSHGGCARQVFLPTGPLALLPLADILDAPEGDLKADAGKWQSVVWTLPTNQALDMLSKGDTTLANALAQASGFELGNVIDILSTASFPLSAIHAKTYIQEGLALIGDAAHGVHPLAGQGLNLGLLDVAALTDALLSEYQRSSGAVFASLAALRRYEAARRVHNATMMHAYSAIGFLFASQPLPLWSRFEWLRSEVLNRMGKSAMLNSFFTEQAAGKGRLGRWA